jgi:translation initiation factor eIF-2B subunit gamma
VNSIRNYAIVHGSLEWLKGVFPQTIVRSKETKIGRSCKLTGAVLGDHCSLGEKVKLTNVIGMDHVTIEAGAEITNSIISSNALIGEGAFIKDCLLGPKFHVLPAARHVNEHLTVVEETFFEA